MKFDNPPCPLPVSIGQPCFLSLVDGTHIRGEMTYCDDAIVSLDNVVVFDGGNHALTGSRGLFPLVQIRWIKPE